ncbi:hypothetical protein IJ818_04410 [bacterium]|nr:hypothetical protein [bacterium]
MKERFLGIILISLFLIQFYAVTSSKEFVCCKRANTCHVKKLFYDKQVLNTYDLDRIERVNWRWKYGKRFRYQQVYIMYKMLNEESVDPITLIKTDFADKKVEKFNEYLKNGEEEFKFNDLQLYLIISTIFTLFFFVPFGVVLLRKDVNLK